MSPSGIKESSKIYKLDTESNQVGAWVRGIKKAIFDFFCELAALDSIGGVGFKPF
jgi:hypothetical protein